MGLCNSPHSPAFSGILGSALMCVTENGRRECSLLTSKGLATLLALQGPGNIQSSVTLGKGYSVPCALSSPAIVKNIMEV